MSQKLFHDQSPRKYGTRPGSNLQPMDLQIDQLPITDYATQPLYKHNYLTSPATLY